jgi:trans-aconitate methyltransferase
MNPDFPSHLHTGKHNEAVNEDTYRQITSLRPHTVVDVGAGDGFYGKMIKHLDPTIRVTAIEKSAEYLEKFDLAFTYPVIIVGDIVELILGLTGDLIIFGDILEHLEEKNVHVVLHAANERFAHIIVNGPVGFQPQQHDNPNEIHRCGLDRNTFEGFRVLEYNTYCGGMMMNCLIARHLS